MRPLLYICLLAAFIPAACKKSTLRGANGTTGDWKLTQYTQGFSGVVIRISADSLVVLSLRGKDYQSIVNGVVKDAGTYTIDNEETIFNTGKTPTLHLNSTQFPSGGAPGLVVELVHDTLTLSMNAYDGDSYLYVREN